LKCYNDQFRNQPLSVDDVDVGRYQRGNQKIPKGKSEDTKGEIRRYQRGNQKIPKGQSEDTKGAIKRYQRSNQKITKG
jgi:hypothetical protein